MEKHADVEHALGYPSALNPRRCSRSHSRVVALLKWAVLVVTAMVYLVCFYEPNEFKEHPCVAEVSPIGLDEFYSRRSKLSDALGSDVYISEPSVNTYYYVGVAPDDWWLSERPWLVALVPLSKGTHEIVVLTPAFELSRAQGLAFSVYDKDEIVWLPWEETDDPYGILVRYIGKRRHGSSWAFQVEENVRTFVTSGLTDAGISANGAHNSSAIGAHDTSAIGTHDTSAIGTHDTSVEPASYFTGSRLVSLAIREQRMVKTDVELELLECAGKITLDSIRTVRKKLWYGITEKQAESVMIKALTAGGLRNLDHIVLFGHNAALPHAESSDWKKLEKGEFVLVDVGGQLHGYTSDITRTMLLDPSKELSLVSWLPQRIRESSWMTQWLFAAEPEYPSKRAEHLWNVVKDAQTTAMQSLGTKAVSCGAADLAARQVIEDAGYGPYFTTRLGHGYGLQVHEHPFLNAGNVNQELLPGEAFTMEPGIYIERSYAGDDSILEPGIGIRLEDMVLRTPGGYRLLSQRQALSPWDP